MRSSYRFGLVVTSAAAFALIPVCRPAQTSFSIAHQAPDTTGVWRPFADYLPTLGQATRGGREANALNRAQVRTLLETLARIADVFRAAKSLNPPMGFDVEPGRAVESVRFNPPGGPAARRLELRLREYLLWCETCEVKRAGEISASIEVAVNSIPAALRGRGPIKEDDLGPMFYAPWDDGTVAGFPRFDNGVVVLTRIARPLWVPVSQQRYIRSEIRDRTGEWQRHRGVSAEGSPYEQWLSGRAKRLRKIEEAYRGIAKADPKAAEQYRAQAMKTDAEVGEGLKKGESARLAQAQTHASFYQQTLQALESELASLSPAELAAPAYYDPDSKRPSHLTDPSAPGAQRIVEPNPTFFEPRGVLGTQLIVVWGLHHSLAELERDIKANVGWRVPRSRADEANPLFLARACAQMQADLDWQRLASLLD